MDRAAAIRAYYWEHFASLPFATQFHFASRLAAWEKDPQAQAALNAMRAQFVPTDQVMLRAQLQSLLVEEPRTTMPAYERRLPFFEQYTQLYGLHQALFRVRHLETIYNMRANTALAELVPPAAVKRLVRQLTQDPEALRVLSTLAVNTIYLAQRYYLGQPLDNTPEDIFALREGYETDDPEELRLMIYLLTHCIIADSNFYVEALTADYREVYQEMLAYIDQIAAQHFDELSLDIKLEFLVCCRIADYQSSLKARIEAECATSLSTEGTFLVDTHNLYASNTTKRNFVASEHRNVLYILSQSPYKPMKDHQA